MLKIPVIKDNINKALKILKRKFKQTGRLKEVRERKYYTKPSRAKKEAKNKSDQTIKYKQDNDE